MLSENADNGGRSRTASARAEQVAEIVRKTTDRSEKIESLGGSTYALPGPPKLPRPNRSAPPPSRPLLVWKKMATCLDGATQHKSALFCVTRESRDSGEATSAGSRSSRPPSKGSRRTPRSSPTLGGVAPPRRSSSCRDRSRARRRTPTISRRSSDELLSSAAEMNAMRRPKRPRAAEGTPPRSRRSRRPSNRCRKGISRLSSRRAVGGRADHHGGRRGRAPSRSRSVASRRRGGDGGGRRADRGHRRGDGALDPRRRRECRRRSKGRPTATTSTLPSEIAASVEEVAATAEKNAAAIDANAAAIEQLGALGAARRAERQRSQRTRREQRRRRDPARGVDPDASSRSSRRRAQTPSAWQRPRAKAAPRWRRSIARLRRDSAGHGRRPRRS